MKDCSEVLNLLKTFNNDEDSLGDADDACYFCKESDIIMIDGNYTCESCGTLNQKYIDMQAEWRFYGTEDSRINDPNRCGMPTNDLLPNSSLGSIVSFKPGESFDMKIIRKYHMWNSMSYKERSLYTIFDNITVHAINGGISQTIIDEAKTYYKKVSESKISRGDNRCGLIASSIYVSCKTNKVPRSTKEIAKMFNIKPSTMNFGCKKFQDIVKVEIKSTKSRDFIERFSSKLKISMEIRDLCRDIVERAENLNICTENTPTSLVAGVMYLCNVLCDLGISKKAVGLACDTSSVTLSKCYKKLHAYRGQLFPEDAIYKWSIK